MLYNVCVRCGLRLDSVRNLSGLGSGSLSLSRFRRYRTVYRGNDKFGTLYMIMFLFKCPEKNYY